MAVIYQIKERRVIPNWRDFKRTLQLGELVQSNKSINPILMNIDRSILDWEQIKNIGTAADLVNSSFVSGIKTSEVNEAIDLIKSDNEKNSSSLLELSTLIENESLVDKGISSKSILEVDVDTINQFQTFINNESFHRIINKTKNRSKNDLINPIIWVELARFYSIRGHDHKSEKAIMTALHLAPNNRFVLRSATRYFIHKKKFEKALYYLRKAESLKHDPWLISAHIATSSIMGRFSPLINEGKRLIDSRNFSNFELTELSSSLGTLEFKDGSYKKAKKFFSQSMLDPNDNSLAQLEWVSKDDRRFQIDPFQYENVINPFEARALDLFERGNWHDSLDNTIKWFLDMPFSKRPVILGSYIAGSLLKDKNAAIVLCQVGLQANPYDATLLNNLVYNISTSDDDHLLDTYVPQMMDIDIHGLSDQSKITFQATLGLVALKKGETDLGISLYKQAIENASRIKNEYLKNLAIINFAIELFNLNLPEQKTYIDIVKKMKINENQKDLLFMQNEVLKKIDT